MADEAEAKNPGQPPLDNEGKNDGVSSYMKSINEEGALLCQLYREQVEVEARSLALRKEIRRRQENLGLSPSSDEEVAKSRKVNQKKTVTSTQNVDPEAELSEESPDDESSDEDPGAAGPFPTTSSTRISAEVEELLQKIKNLPPPKLKLARYQKATPADIQAENLKRKRIETKPHPLSTNASGEPKRSTDIRNAVVAPSVMVEPLPLGKLPSFDEVVRELGIPELLIAQGHRPPLYVADCRILSQDLLKKLINKRAEHLVSRMESKRVDRGTQTFITQVGKQHVAGCVNCRSRGHHFKNCELPYRPGFCQVCGADGFEAQDCIYPHGIEHEMALGRCLGCSRDLSLYCPECPDCNIRYAGLVDWLRLNYATWPTERIPEDHRYIVNEAKGTLKRHMVRFSDPGDTANQIRSFLIREKALVGAKKLANPAAATAEELSKTKRLLAIQALQKPFVMKSLDEIMEERPELSDGEEIKVIIPSKYKQQRDSRKQ
ncbi:uncharacterized protein [Venturia canescens]|uniref:uncharacterized protein n=1 Tax=Venturia canescens TaxID=32260 RepID=UPI001C9C245D|nr:uncharacterized protein LOC122411367 [Venturia canescens]XP_043276051.1 uncharacterized protein LOC122411368 [Venturia canescens]